MDNLEKRFEALLLKQLNIKKSNLKPGTKFRQDLGMCLRDFVILIMEIEAEFDIDVSDREMERIVTVDDAFSCLLSKLRNT